jgi:hypothetical protein
MLLKLQFRALSLLLLAACGGGADPALSQRISDLEEELRTVNRELKTLKTAAESTPELPFRFSCEAPLHNYYSQNDAILTCRAAKPSPEGIYPQCNIRFQKEGTVDTKDYFELAVNSTPMLYTINNYSTQQTKINGAPAFESSFEAQHTALPMKMMGALLPYQDGLYVVTCFATTATFPTYQEAFRRSLSSFDFKLKSQ